jgi:hypothetical protein
MRSDYMRLTSCADQEGRGERDRERDRGEVNGRRESCEGEESHKPFVSIPNISTEKSSGDKDNL